MQEKSRNLSGKQGEESVILDKMSCINGCMVKSNLVISLVPLNATCDISGLHHIKSALQCGGSSPKNRKSFLRNEFFGDFCGIVDQYFLVKKTFGL